MKDDKEIRKAFVEAIRTAIRQLSNSYNIRINGFDDNLLFPIGSIMDKYQNWQFLEALSLLTILMKADNIKTKYVENIFGKTGPIVFQENGNDRYLWAQHRLSSTQTNLKAIPDLLVTSSITHPELAIERIIECKCMKKLGAHEIRTEYGKALDLNVASYLIWSFTNPVKGVKDGAKHLGLDVEVLGFDTNRGDEFIKHPETLLQLVAAKIETSKKDMNFGSALIRKAEQLEQRFPIIRRH